LFLFGVKIQRWAGREEGEEDEAEKARQRETAPLFLLRLDGGFFF